MISGFRVRLFFCLRPVSCILKIGSLFRCLGLRRTLLLPFQNKLLSSVISLIIICILLGGFIFYKRNFTCSVDEGNVLFKTICDLHNQNLAFGNLCKSLCTEKEMELLSCIVHHSGKEIVTVAKRKGVKMMLKSSHKDVNQFDQIYFSDSSKVTVHVYPEMDLFLDMVIQSVSYYLNHSIIFSPKNKIIDLVWTQNYSFLNGLVPEQQHAAMSNLWHLLQQPEYVLSKVYEPENIFPKVIGTCGHIYAVEFLNPIDSYFGVLHPSWRYSFQLRAQWALDLLRLFESFENSFHSVLHICDVKIGHFGFTSNGTLRLLDLDMAYFEETLQANMKAPSSCRSNYDCAFIDCHGSCKQGQCESNITNNNIQRLCTNIFYGYSGQDIFGLLGLPPSLDGREFMNQLLLCMRSPAFAKTAVKKIKELLNKSASTLQTSIGPLN